MLLRRRNQTEIVGCVEDIPNALRGAEPGQTVTALNAKWANPDRPSSDLIDHSVKSGQTLLCSQSESVWTVLPTTADTLAENARGLLADKTASLHVVAPDDETFFDLYDHTVNKKNRFAVLPLGMRAQFHTVHQTASVILRTVGDFKAFTPESIVDGNGQPKAPEFNRIVERDKTGSWYEQGLWAGQGKTASQIIASKAITNYCQNFGDIYMMAAVYDNYWVFMPAELTSPRFQTPTLRRLGVHAARAAGLVFYDPGAERYTDTTQLGLRDNIYPDGQLQYDVDQNGVDITKVERGRSGMRFSHVNSFDTFGHFAESDEWDWSGGPAVQVVRL